MIPPRHSFVLISAIVSVGVCFISTTSAESWFCSPFDVEKLRRHRENLGSWECGQRVALELTYNAIEAHMQNPSPNSPLVISWYGATGVGKSFAAKKLADVARVKIFRKWGAMAPSPLELAVDLQTSIDSCPSTIFVYDDFAVSHAHISESLKQEEAPVGSSTAQQGMTEEHMTAIEHFLDSVPENQAHARAIHIFISNLGALHIEQFLQGHSDARNNQVVYNDLQDHFRVRNWRNPALRVLVTRSLINLHIPWYPLEKEHVHCCVKSEIARMSNLIGTDHPQSSVDVTETAQWRMVTKRLYDKDLFAIEGCRNVGVDIKQLETRIYRDARACDRKYPRKVLGPVIVDLPKDDQREFFTVSSSCVDRIYVWDKAYAWLGQWMGGSSGSTATDEL